MLPCVVPQWSLLTILALSHHTYQVRVRPELQVLFKAISLSGCHRLRAAGAGTATVVASTKAGSAGTPGVTGTSTSTAAMGGMTSAGTTRTTGTIRCSNCKYFRVSIRFSSLMPSEMESGEPFAVHSISISIMLSFNPSRSSSLIPS